MKFKNILAVLALSLLSPLALAGQSFIEGSHTVVELNLDGSGSAHGSMSYARFSDNDIEFIGCGIRTYEDGSGGVYNSGFCQAGDVDGVRGFCSTENPALLDTMKATGDYSYVIFSWDSAGLCSHIGFSTQSFYIPEQAVAAKKK